MAAGTVRQRKGKEKSTPTEAKLKITKDAPSSTNATSPANSSKPNAPPLWLRIFLFLIFPTITGSVGLLTSYLKNMDLPFSASGKTEGHEINFDRDFIYPFLLTLALVCVLWYQTRGFASNQVTPIVAWPKVKKRRKVIRTTRIVDDEDSEEENEEEEEIIQQSTKRKGSRKED